MNRPRVFCIGPTENRRRCGVHIAWFWKVVMRVQAFAFIAVSLCAVLIASPARLSPRYHTVYILEMANGLDQYLANRLTSTRAIWVVLQPESADAVFTETLDDSFWNWLARTYPHASASAGPASSRGAASRTDSQQRGRYPGMVFLVDPRTRVVLWSTYVLPKTSSSSELNRTADQIARQLKASFGKN